MEDCGLVGGDVVVARQGVVGVVHVDRVRVLQLPLPPGPLQPLPTSLPLHVRPERESGTTALNSSSRLRTLVQTFT